MIKPISVTCDDCRTSCTPVLDTRLSRHRRRGRTVLIVCSPRTWLTGLVLDVSLKWHHPLTSLASVSRRTEGDTTDMASWDEDWEPSSAWRSVRYVGNHSGPSITCQCVSGPASACNELGVSMSRDSPPQSLVDVVQHRDKPLSLVICYPGP
jgi:hypothetical protein